jgi:hypothetical protein
MGNRPCAALCYDIDHRKSIHETTKIINKSSALWAKQLSADFDDEYEPQNHCNNYNGMASHDRRRKESNADSTKRIPNPQSASVPPPPKPTTPTTSLLQQELATIEPQHTHSSAYYYSGFPTNVRSMSSDTSGREARSEHDLSRRSSTCEREEIGDEISMNRSCSRN